MYFNHRASAKSLAWRAESRGLATETNYLLPGVISPLACAALEQCGVPLPREHRDAIQCSDADLESADLVIAVKQTEHAPLLASRYPRFTGRVRFWEIHDVNDDPTRSAMTELRQRVDELLDELSAS